MAQFFVVVNGWLQVSVGCLSCVIYVMEVTPIMGSTTQKKGVVLGTGICDGMWVNYFGIQIVSLRTLNQLYAMITIIFHITKCCWDQGKDRTRPATSPTMNDSLPTLIPVNKQHYP
jgi:hypothetical protein